MEECSKCGSYNTYTQEVAYGLFQMEDKTTCSDCGYVEYSNITEDKYE